MTWRGLLWGLVTVLAVILLSYLDGCGTPQQAQDYDPHQRWLASVAEEESVKAEAFLRVARRDSVNVTVMPR